MAMLTADEALKLYPRGLWVFDSTGRQLARVMACNAETGEVIIWSEGTYSPLDWIRWRLRRVKPRLLWGWLYEGSIHTRHGFWPAPLRLVERRIEIPEHWNCRCTSIPTLADPVELAP